MQDSIAAVRNALMSESDAKDDGVTWQHSSHVTSLLALLRVIIGHRQGSFVAQSSPILQVRFQCSM